MQCFPTIPCISHCSRRFIMCTAWQRSLSMACPAQELEAAAERAGAAAALAGDGSAQLQAELHELRADYDELTLCLGQESAKARPRSRFFSSHGGLSCVHHSACWSMHAGACVLLGAPVC